MMTNKSNSPEYYEPNTAFGTEHYCPNFILVDKKPTSLENHEPFYPFNRVLFWMILGVLAIVINAAPKYFDLSKPQHDYDYISNVQAQVTDDSPSARIVSGENGVRPSSRQEFLSEQVLPYPVVDVSLLSDSLLSITAPDWEATRDSIISIKMSEFEKRLPSIKLIDIIKYKVMSDSNLLMKQEDIITDTIKTKILNRGPLIDNISKTEVSDDLNMEAERCNMMVEPQKEELQIEDLRKSIEAMPLFLEIPDTLE